MLFLALNDGSGPGNLQVIVREDVYALGDLKTTGTSVVVEGELRAPPESAKGQAIEMHATKILMCGKCDGAVYPISKKKQTLEFSRKDSLATADEYHRERGASAQRSRVRDAHLLQPERFLIRPHALHHSERLRRGR